MKTPKSIRELFSLPGFVAGMRLRGYFGDRFARVVVLRRRKKQRSAPAVVAGAEAAMTSARVWRGIFPWPAGASTLSSSAGGSIARGVAPCL